MKIRISTSNGIIGAIKAHRYFTGAGLKESKDYVESKGQHDGNNVTVEAVTKLGQKEVDAYLHDPYNNVRITVIGNEVEINVKYNGDNATLTFKSDSVTASINSNADRALHIADWLLKNT